MNKTGGSSINPVIREKDEKIVKLSRLVELLKYEKVKADFLRQFMKFLSGNYSYDALLEGASDFFRNEFKATYVGIFLFDKESFIFRYYTGSGYHSELIPHVDEAGSIMGETLHNGDTIVVENMSERYFHIPLNQSPAEYNVICVPIFTERKTLILRVANIPNRSIFKVLSEIIQDAILALTKSLDHIYNQSISEQTLRGVRISLRITRLLEKNLSKKEIFHHVFDQVDEMFEDQMNMIAIRNSDNTFRVIEKSEKEFYLGGSPAAHNLYLQNLFSFFPDGDAFIENIHKSPRWTWADMKYHSIHMAPLHSEGELAGAIISVSKGEPLGETQKTILNLVATQTSSTLDRSAYFRKQEEFASIDGLTGLMNRRIFDTVLTGETAVAGRYGRPLSILMFDIDFFKKFNDVHGHSTGDEVLQVVAQTIMRSIREVDRAFRYGGEEFIIMCPETTAKDAEIVAERLRKNVEDTRTSGNLQVTISIGVTQFIPGEAAEKFAKRVDDLLYVSKEKGRNCVSVG